MKQVSNKEYEKHQQYQTMCYMGEYLRRMDSVSSVQDWTTIRRRSESTCWRCWASSKAKESWNE